MADGEPKLHPHIFVPNAPSSEAFTSPRSGRSNQRFPERGRAAHAAHLLNQLRETQPAAVQRAEQQRALGLDEGNGIYLVFKSSPGFDLKFESLDVRNAGIELCAVRKIADDQTEATVWVPDGKLDYFLKKVTAYRDENTKPNKRSKRARPKNEDLVSSIADIQLAALQALWTDAPELYPDPNISAVWEVWLRSSNEINHSARFRNFAARFDLAVSPQEISFIDRTVLLVHGRGRDLARSNDILGAIAEVRLAKTTADFFTSMAAIEQKEWLDDLLARVVAPSDTAPFVCLLDTGLNHAHPLLADVADQSDLHTYNPNWGTADVYGHGTPMAGLAVYGDLTEALASGRAIPLSHRLESVKLFNEQDPHAQELYGAVTQECISRVEIKPERTRVFCLAVTASDNRDRGHPSSWSAAIDASSSGFTDEERRLILISAGNTALEERKNYPDSNFTDGVHDPAQAWNALCIGGTTEKAVVDQTKYPGWTPVAQAGDLSPASCTSVTWKETKWPIKPDIVLEAGNMALHLDHEDPDYIDDALSLLSTPHDFAINKPLVTFGDTSAATALAANLIGMLWAKYPQLSPEAVRGLMIHSSHWTEKMIQRASDEAGVLDKEVLLRCFGYGTPSARKLLSSADNSLTLVAQGTIQPFHKVEGGIKTREMNVHELPWPKEALEALQQTEVTLRVTLSYFIEPNPGERGWSTKYGYQSHGLRFDVRRATETMTQFQARVNRAARTDDYEGDDAHNETGKWFFGMNQTIATVGSVRSNSWTGKAADLATRGFVAVYPTYGWWNKRPNLRGYEKSTNYALIATITTPETDIYTPVANLIKIPVIIET